MRTLDDKFHWNGKTYTVKEFERIARDFTQVGGWPEAAQLHLKAAKIYRMLQREPDTTHQHVRAMHEKANENFLAAASAYEVAAVAARNEVNK